MIRFCWFIPLCFLLASCAAKLPYPANHPLTKETFTSPGGKIGGKIPLGWISPSVDTLPPGYIAWLIKNDYSATCTISELVPDRTTEKQIGKKGLLLLAQISMSLRLGDEPAVTEPVKYRMNGREFCSYETEEGGCAERIVVFCANDRYYECTMKTVRGKRSSPELKNLYTAQQTVLSELTFR